MGTSTLCTVNVSGTINGQPINESGQFPRNADGTVNASFNFPNQGNLELLNLPCPTTAPISVIIPGNDFDLKIEVIEG